jgi:hypothetical protein
MVDRKGNEHPEGIAPDEEVLSEATISTADPVIRAASVRLSQMRACRAASRIEDGPFALELGFI